MDTKLLENILTNLSPLHVYLFAKVFLGPMKVQLDSVHPDQTVHDSNDILQFWGKVLF